MAPIRSVKNQYLGINAHLHSFWQAEHKWNRFHNAYMVATVYSLKTRLFPLGYSAELEEGLQIRRVGDDFPRAPRSDILIYKTPSTQSSLSIQPQVQPWRLEDLTETEEDYEHPYMAIRIYKRSTGNSRGEPVGWIELLSPTNKGQTKDAYMYLAKRRLLLEQGMVFTEIDFLHETPPTFERLASYSRHETGAAPYHIFVMDPRPDYRHTDVYPYPFSVERKIPSVTLPLLDDDRLNFDFDQPYQTNFEQMLYGLDDVDYTQLPLNFDRYSPADQQRIANRMLAVIEAARRGDDLEVPPQPLENLLPLDEALKRIEAAS